MSKYSKGDRVVATKDIGGVVRDSVSKGTQGVVIDTSWGGGCRVLFHCKGFWSDKDIEVEVDVDEIG